MGPQPRADQRHGIAGIEAQPRFRLTMKMRAFRPPAKRAAVGAAHFPDMSESWMRAGCRVAGVAADAVRGEDHRSGHAGRMSTGELGG
jgi:hypothetical protein